MGWLWFGKRKAKSSEDLKAEIETITKHHEYISRINSSLGILNECYHYFLDNDSISAHEYLIKRGMESVIRKSLPDLRDRITGESSEGKIKFIFLSKDEENELKKNLDILYGLANLSYYDRCEFTSKSVYPLIRRETMKVKDYMKTVDKILECEKTLETQTELYKNAIETLREVADKCKVKET